MKFLVCGVILASVLLDAFGEAKGILKELRDTPVSSDEDLPVETAPEKVIKESLLGVKADFPKGVGLIQIPASFKNGTYEISKGPSGNVKAPIFFPFGLLFPSIPPFDFAVGFNTNKNLSWAVNQGNVENTNVVGNGWTTPGWGWAPTEGWAPSPTAAPSSGWQPSTGWTTTPGWAWTTPPPTSGWQSPPPTTQGWTSPPPTTQGWTTPPPSTQGWTTAGPAWSSMVQPAAAAPNFGKPPGNRPPFQNPGSWNNPAASQAGFNKPVQQGGMNTAPQHPAPGYNFPPQVGSQYGSASTGPNQSPPTGSQSVLSAPNESQSNVPPRPDPEAQVEPAETPTLHEPTAAVSASPAQQQSGATEPVAPAAPAQQNQTPVEPSTTVQQQAAPQSVSPVSDAHPAPVQQNAVVPAQEPIAPVPAAAQINDPSNDMTSQTFTSEAQTTPSPGWSSTSTQTPGGWTQNQQGLGFGQRPSSAWSQNPATNSGRKPHTGYSGIVSPPQVPHVPANIVA